MPRPCIEPDRSSTNARLTGGRRRDASRATVGASSSTRMKRSERPPARIRFRSVRQVRRGWAVSVMAGLLQSSSSSSRAIRISRSTRLFVWRSSGRRRWSSTSGVSATRSQVERSGSRVRDGQRRRGGRCEGRGCFRGHVRGRSHEQRSRRRCRCRRSRSRGTGQHPSDVVGRRIGRRSRRPRFVSDRQANVVVGQADEPGPDLRQWQVLALEAPDESQPGEVSLAVSRRLTAPRRRSQQPLRDVIADGSRRDVGQPGEVGQARRSRSIGSGVPCGRDDDSATLYCQDIPRRPEMITLVGWTSRASSWARRESRRSCCRR